jgi:TadE-like protein
MRPFARTDEGQSTTELALLLGPLLLIIVFGLLELAGLMTDAMTMSAASREGARIGGALVNGGGALGCSSGQSPNAAAVDPNVVAAVERVLTGTGTRITLSDVNEIRIWKSTSSGNETLGLVNVWTYQLNSGPLIDGDNLDFVQQSQPWLPCTRNNVTPADSIGVTVSYTYRARTPLRFLMPVFNQLTITERSVMAENATR